jgi:hypothetical protein
MEEPRSRGGVLTLYVHRGDLFVPSRTPNVILVVCSVYSRGQRRGVGLLLSEVPTTARLVRSSSTSTSVRRTLSWTIWV